MQNWTVVAYTLKYLDQLVREIAHGKLGEGFILSETNMDSILGEALKEMEKIRAQLIQDVLVFNKEKAIEVYIKNYQVELTLMLD